MLPFDELNRLAREQKSRSMDIEKYFSAMELPVEEKENRIEFAKKLEDRLFLFLAFIYVLAERGSLGNLPAAKEGLARDIAAMMEEYTYPDSAMLEYINRYVDNFVDTTMKRGIVDGEEAAYWFSEDRARFSAEDEANTLFNYEQYRQAVEDGYTHKRWIAMKDERVRLTHAEVDGTTVPIDEYFSVGDWMMRFPKDPEAGPEETVNCRCSLRYLNKFQISSERSKQVRLDYLSSGKGSLDKRSSSILKRVPESGSYYRFEKDKIQIDDMPYLSMATNHEFALFRSKRDDLLIHGTYYHCQIPDELIIELCSGRYQWIAHTHLDQGKLVASSDDRKVLKAMGQNRSTLISARTGKMVSFGQYPFDD